jgi:hypothetical protein
MGSCTANNSAQQENVEICENHDDDKSGCKTKADLCKWLGKSYACTAITEGQENAEYCEKFDEDERDCNKRALKCKWTEEKRFCFATDPIYIETCRNAHTFEGECEKRKPFCIWKNRPANDAPKEVKKTPAPNSNPITP